MRKWLTRLWLAASALGTANGAQRFPPPQFESGHTLPPTTEPSARALWMEYGDVLVLLVVLSLATWLVLKQRSRRGVVVLGLFSVFYFGFWREGCVCAIGSIQNMTQAIFDSSYAIPLVVVGFGLLPLIFALLFGRVFCAAACPHGALQDVMLVKPVTVPAWLEQGLRLFAYSYLGLAVAFATTGSGYIICQFDPFVPIFRLSGGFGMVLFGISLLILGMFVGRPYCRYLCPYGVLLALASSVSKWRVRITPDTCTQCRLCERSCPYGAIQKSSPGTEAIVTPLAKRRLALLILALPVVVGVGVLAGSLAGNALARKNPRIHLAERIHQEEQGLVEGVTDASAAFRATGRPVEELYAEASDIKERFVLASKLSGAWIGLVAGLKLIGLAMYRRRPDYEADRLLCVGCARCYSYCPQELQRRGIPVAPVEPA